MYQTVIFDLDGTLLNTMHDLTAAGNYVCKQNGWPQYSASEFITMVGYGISSLVRQFSPADFRSPLLLASSIAQFQEYYAGHCLDRTEPYFGIRNLLKNLHKRGVQLVVYSNKSDDICQKIIAHFFPECFALVRGKRPGVPLKPDPAGLRAVLDELHADMRSTLIVGDSHVDIETAHHLGLPVCCVSWGYRSRETLTDAEWIVDLAEELEKIVLQEQDNILSLLRPADPYAHTPENAKLLDSIELLDLSGETDNISDISGIWEASDSSEYLASTKEEASLC